MDVDEDGVCTIRLPSKASKQPQSAFDGNPVTQADLKTLIDKVARLESQVAAYEGNQALLYTVIGKFKILEGKFQQLKDDTESSFAQLREEKSASSPSLQLNHNVVVEEDCEPLTQHADPENDDSDWQPTKPDDSDNSISDVESASNPKTSVKSGSGPGSSVKQIFKCGTCQKLFLTKRGLVQHMKSHHEDIVTTPVNWKDIPVEEPAATAVPLPNADYADRICTICEKVFSRPSHVSKHMLMIHGVVTIYQPLPQRSELRADELNTHGEDSLDESDPARENQEDNSNSNFTCAICSIQCKSSRDLYEHHRKQHPSSLKPFHCKLCEDDKASFYRAQHLAEHYTSQHPTPNGLTPAGKKCSECGLMLSKNSHLARHLLSFHGIGTMLSCEVCEQSFNRIDKLKLHQIREHGKISESLKARRRNPPVKTEKEFPCTNCGKVFNKNIALQIHTPGCNGLKLFSCEKCDKSFAHQSNLRQHIENVHHRAGRQLCTICGKSFYGSANFRTHVLSHGGEQNKTHKCSTCDRAFLRRNDLKYHEKIHTGELNHQCPHCDRKFRVSGTLKRHIRLHTGEKPYACDICGRCFTQHFSLLKHKEAHQRGTARTVLTEDQKWRLKNRKNPSRIYKKRATKIKAETETGEEGPQVEPDQESTEGVKIHIIEVDLQNSDVDEYIEIEPEKVEFIGTSNEIPISEAEVIQAIMESSASSAPAS